MNAIGWIFTAAAAGAVIAGIAHMKGRSFLAWWVYGTVLGIVALPHLLLARDLSSDRRWSPVRYNLPSGGQNCPHCGLPVNGSALVCRHCRQSIDPRIRHESWPQYQGRGVGPAFGYPIRAEGAAHADETATNGAIHGVSASWWMPGYSASSPFPAGAEAGIAANVASARAHGRPDVAGMSGGPPQSHDPAAPVDARPFRHPEADRVPTTETRERERRGDGATGRLDSARGERAASRERGRARRQEPGPAEGGDAAYRNALNGGAKPDPQRNDDSRPPPGPADAWTGAYAANADGVGVTRRRRSGRKRDSGAPARALVLAALVACVAAALFLTSAWQLIPQVVRLVSPAALYDPLASRDAADDRSAVDPFGGSGGARGTGRADAPVLPPPVPPTGTSGAAADRDVPPQTVRSVPEPAMPPVVAGNEPASAASGGADNPAIASLPETRTGDPRRGDGPDGRAGTMRPPAVESDRRPATTAAPAPKAAGATPTARPTPTADTADERAAAEPTFEDVVERLQSASPAAGPSGSVGRGVGEGSAISAVGEVVYELQRKLKAKGYDPGVIDGRLGSRTRQALRAYQQDTGLPVTGEINNAVLIAFGIIS